MNLRLLWLGCVVAFGYCGGCSHPSTHAVPRAAHQVSQPDAAPDGAVTAAPYQLVSPYTYEWFVRAELAAASGDLVAARDGYRRALAGADEDPLVMARLALVLDRLGERRQAEQLLSEAEALDSRSEAVWMARGQLAERDGHRDAALHAYERAEQFAPRSGLPPRALARVLADAPERVTAVWRRFADRNDAFSPHHLHAQLQLALDAGDLEGALDALTLLQRVISPTALQREAVARLALDRNRPHLARRVLGAPWIQMIDRVLWLRVALATGEHGLAELLLASATPDELRGLATLAAYQLALGDHTRARELALLAWQWDGDPQAVDTLLRASGLHALAEEVQEQQPRR